MSSYTVQQYQVNPIDTEVLPVNTLRRNLVISYYGTDICYMSLGEMCTPTLFTFRLGKNTVVDLGTWGGPIHCCMANMVGMIQVSEEV